MSFEVLAQHGDEERRQGEPSHRVCAFVRRSAAGVDNQDTSVEINVAAVQVGEFAPAASRPRGGEVRAGPWRIIGAVIEAGGARRSSVINRTTRLFDSCGPAGALT
ncbi:hypothetical protein [Lentzea sp. NPDC004782]|uniref:hypothetical protein n=1 Tax=Lentzea sp. NPDC004782 TaxID=3154458 RepID=UPI0033AAB4B6